MWLLFLHLQPCMLIEIHAADRKADGRPKALPWLAQLTAHDVSCEDIRTDPYTQKRFTFFQDPDGLPLELYEIN